MIGFWHRAGVAFACLTLVGIGGACAETYPSRPVRWIVGFAAGGPTDLIARIIAQQLSDRLGQQFLVENRTGAGSNIAVQSVATSPADGYTLLFATPTNVVNTTLYKKLPFNLLSDIAGVAALLRAPNVMEVNPSVPAKSVAEFIAYAKANPGKINMASGGVGTTVHMSGELFMAMTGTKLVHVVYRGTGPATTDLIAGQMQVMFDNAPGALPHVRAGSVRALAVTTATRSQALPDVPAVAETVPGYEASVWYGVGAPKGTPPEIVETLNREINAVLADPKINARFAELGATPLLFSPAEFDAFMAAETEKWAKVVKFSGASAE